jgi:putative oxidoreductase
VQRLFSTFPNGWPGRGLLVLRLAVGAMLMGNGVHCLTSVSHHENAVLAVTEVVAGLLILTGFCTPVGGAVAIVSLSWSLIDHGSLSQSKVLLLCISLALAMLGPGAWSIDARLFGRRRMKIE